MIRPNKAFLPVDVADAKRKYSQNVPMNLRELAVALEVGYNAVKTIKAQGVPMFAGRVFPEDFKAWRLAQPTHAGVRCGRKSRVIRRQASRLA